MEFLAERRTIKAGTTIDLDDLGSFDIHACTPNTSGRSGIDLLAIAEKIRAEAIRRLVPFDNADASAIHGYTSPARQFACEAGLAADDASLVASVVRLCGRYALTAKAVSSGDLPLGHAAVLAAAERNMSGHFAEDEAQLLGLADGRDEAAFRRAMQNWRHNRMSREDAQDGTSSAFDQRFCTTQRSFDGSGTGRFALDAEGMDIVEDALWSRPDRADGPVPARTKAQRQADNLVDMAAEFTGKGRAPSSDDPDWSPNPTGYRTSKPSNVDVVIDLRTLEGEHHDAIAAIRAEFASGHPAPLPILEKLLCDATFRRVLMDGAVRFAH